MNKLMLFVFNQMFLRWLFCLAGSQAFTANLATIKTSYDSGADAATLAARATAGPQVDVDGMLLLLLLKAQEMATVINQLCSGSIGGGTTGIFRTGDASAANNYALLQNILTSLTS
jgi:hypothetical protein